MKIKLKGITRHGKNSTNFLPRLPIRSTTTNEWRWLDENHFQIRR